MGATPKLQIPYIEPSDILANYPTQDKAQADRLEAVFGNRVRVTPFFTASAGWALGSTNQIDHLGSYAQYYGTFTRTGAAINVPAIGDITNTQIASFDGGKFSIQSYGPVVSWGSGGRVGAFYLSATALFLGAVGGTGNIATGEAFNVVGSIIIVPITS